MSLISPVMKDLVHC